MIQLSVEVSDLDSENSKVITLPCNLRSELPEHYNYIILACCPDIPLRRNDDIQRLNDILEDINSENPGMTEEYLDVLTEASLSGDLFDEEFARRIRENDFVFEDISDFSVGMSPNETAAAYLATVANVPFAYGVTEDELSKLSDSPVARYINWDKVWAQYRTMGFRLVERRDPVGNAQLRYIVHIR